MRLISFSTDKLRMTITNDDAYFHLMGMRSRAALQQQGCWQHQNQAHP